MSVCWLVGCCCHYFRERQGSYPFEVTLTIDFLFDNSLPDVFKVPLFLSQLIHNSYLIRIFQAITNINRLFCPSVRYGFVCLCWSVFIVHMYVYIRISEPMNFPRGGKEDYLMRTIFYPWNLFCHPPPFTAREGKFKLFDLYVCDLYMCVVCECVYCVCVCVCNLSVLDWLQNHLSSNHNGHRKLATSLTQIKENLSSRFSKK